MYDRRGLLVRIAYLAVAAAFWLVTGLLRRGRPPVVTLYYHGVEPHERTRFERQMAAIAERAIGAEGIAVAIRRRRWPPRVFLTFDDALESVRTVALPVLQRLGIPCAIFAVADHLGRRPAWPVGGAGEVTMSAADLRDAAAICTVGSHGTSHRPLTDLDPQEALAEMVRSRVILERVTGKSVRDLAFPHGACDEDCVKTVVECGYRRVFTLSPPPCGPAHVVIGRMKMTPGAWPLEFHLTAAGAYAWLPPWRRVVGRFLAVGTKVAP